jgi:hypothetical protein
MNMHRPPSSSGNGSSPSKVNQNSNKTEELVINTEQISTLEYVLNSVNNRVDYIVNAARTMGREFNARLSDKRRNYEKECGYPDPSSLTAEYYQNLYNYDAIAARVVEIWPKECWQTNPEIYEDENEEVETEFEADVKAMCDDLDGDNYHKQKEGSVINEVLQRLDINCGISRYAVLYMGVDDGLDPRYPVAGWDTPDSDFNYGSPSEEDTPNPPYFSQINGINYLPDAPPVTAVPPNNKSDSSNQDTAYGRDTNVNPKNNRSTNKRRLRFLQVYPESAAKIIKWETNKHHKRYNQPVQYLLATSVDQPEDGVASGTVVHWSRVIHVADNAVGSNKVFGIPRCQQVLHRILDLKNKLYGGSAEMYWLGALPAIIFKTDPSLGGDVDLNLSLLKDQIERLMHGLQRYASLNGMDAQSLAPTVVDPSPQIQRHIEAICIKIEVAIRIFVGSERGELSSNQDSVQHSRKIRGRNNRFTIPSIVAAFYNRCIKLGIITKPKEGYKIFWPDPDSQAPQEKASVALTLIEAIAKYIQGNVGSVVPPLYLLTSILGGFFTKDEAKTILEEAEKYVQEQKKIQEEETKKNMQMQVDMEIEKANAMPDRLPIERNRKEDTVSRMKEGKKPISKRASQFSNNASSDTNSEDTDKTSTEVKNETQNKE